MVIDKPITGMMLISNEPTVDVDTQAMTICGIEIYEEVTRINSNEKMREQW